MRSGLLSLWLSLAACGARTGLSSATGASDGGPDGGPDGGRADAGRDAGRDVGRDSPTGCPFDIGARIPAVLLSSVDDNARLFVNGVLIDETPRIWSEVGRHEVSLFRHPQIANVLAIEGINVFRIDGLDRGVLAELSATTEVGPVQLVTDARWRMQSFEEPSWQQLVFDDSDWRPPVIEGLHGIAPWGPLFGTSDAAWLWSYDAAAPASAKPERERIFLRRTFYFDVAGRIVDEPTPCP